MKITVDSRIGGEKANKQTLKDQLTEANGKDIALHISCLGGNVADAWTMHDDLKEYSGNVIAEIRGFTASAGTIVAEGAKTLKMSKNSMWLVHKCLAGIIIWSAMNEEQITDLIKNLENIKDGNQKVDLINADIYARKTGKTPKEMLNLMGEEKWLTAEEAKKWGFVDEIYIPDSKQTTAEMTAIYNEVKELDLPKIPKNDMDGLKETFENFKTWVSDKINSIKTSDNKEVKLMDEKEVQDKITAFETEVSNATKELKIKDETIAEFKTKVTEFETELSKLKGSQTNINTDGDPDLDDGGKKLTEQEKALEDNAKNMRSWDGSH